MVIKAAVIVLSDKGYKGEREDTSGDYIRDYLVGMGYQVVEKAILPDEREVIKEALKERVKGGEIDLILTTGGTGLSQRDVTPEATLGVIERRAPGIEVLMVNTGLRHTPYAALSRAVAGTANNVLIINLPGSRRAVEQILPPLAEIIPHAIEKIKGKGGDCGT